MFCLTTCFPKLAKLYGIRAVVFGKKADSFRKGRVTLKLFLGPGPLYSILQLRDEKLSTNPRTLLISNVPHIAKPKETNNQHCPTQTRCQPQTRVQAVGFVVIDYYIIFFALTKVLWIFKKSWLFDEPDKVSSLICPLTPEDSTSYP